MYFVFPGTTSESVRERRASSGNRIAAIARARAVAEQGLTLLAPVKHQLTASRAVQLAAWLATIDHVSSCACVPVRPSQM